MKDFEDFKASLTNEDIEYINDSNLSFSGDLANPDDQLKFVGFVGGLDFARTIRLLVIYHKWLQKQQ